MFIGFDIDDIVLNTYDGLVKASYDLFNIYIPNRPNDFEELSRRLNEKQKDILFKFTLNNLSYLKINKYIIELINLLKNRQNRIVFITQRPPEVEEGLRQLLDIIVPMQYNLRICMPEFTKSDYACQFGLTHFVEDRYKYAKELADCGVKVLLHKRPWNNYREKHPNIYEFRNWDYLKYKLNLQ